MHSTLLIKARIILKSSVHKTSALICHIGHSRVPHLMVIRQSHSTIKMKRIMKKPLKTFKRQCSHSQFRSDAKHINRKYN